jgi:hypothetical protein
MKMLRVAIIGAMLTTVTCVVAGSGQSRQNSPPPITGPSSSPIGANVPSIGRTDPLSTDPLSNRMEEQQMRSRNSDRQKRLVSDTDKLMTLVKQLKEQVESPDKPLQPNDVGKRAEEIEKLAKSVRDRMKG